MTAPDRIHILWNGADAVDNFYEAGTELPRYMGRDVTTAEIFDVLYFKHEQMFRLLGWAAGMKTVILKITAMDTETKVISVAATSEPEFSGDYVIDEEVPPLITRDIDLCFDIVEATS